MDCTRQILSSLKIGAVPKFSSDIEGQFHRNEFSFVKEDSRMIEYPFVDPVFKNSRDRGLRKIKLCSLLDALHLGVGTIEDIMLHLESVSAWETDSTCNGVWVQNKATYSVHLLVPNGQCSHVSYEET